MNSTQIIYNFDEMTWSEIERILILENLEDSYVIIKNKIYKIEKLENKDEEPKFYDFVFLMKDSADNIHYINICKELNLYDFFDTIHYSILRVSCLSKKDVDCLLRMRWIRVGKFLAIEGKIYKVIDYFMNQNYKKDKFRLYDCLSNETMIVNLYKKLVR